MSVLASMRKVSYVEFLKQTSLLASEVREWARSQSPKDREFGVGKLYEFAENAYTEAFNANNFYPNTVDAINYRVQHFKLAQTYLHNFNAQLSLLRQGAKTQNKKVKRWCNYSEFALKLLKGVIEKDKQKRTKLLEK